MAPSTSRSGPVPDGPVRLDPAKEHDPAEPDAAATADYIRSMSGGLSRLAHGAGLDLLAYLLEMVEIEANAAKGRTAGTAGETREPPKAPRRER